MNTFCIKFYGCSGGARLTGTSREKASRTQKVAAF